MIRFAAFIIAFCCVPTLVWAQDTLEAKGRDSIITLQVVTIEASAQAHVAKSSAASAVLNIARLDASSGESLAERLAVLPGVDVLRTGNTIAKPVIRGMSGSRVVIMNNGVRHEGQQWGSEHAPEIDPFAAGQVRVIKGAEGVRYGTDAIGGVIVVDAAPMPAADSRYSGKAQLAGFSNGWRGAGALLLQGGMGARTGLSYRVQGSAQRGGDVRTAHYRMANTGLGEGNASATLQYQHKSGVYQAHFSHFETALGIFRGAHIGNLTDLTEAINRPQPLPMYTPDTFSYHISRPRQEVRHQAFKLEARNLLGQWGTLTTRYALQHNARNEYDARTRGEDIERPQLRFSLYTHSLESVWNHPTKGRFSGQVGVFGMWQNNVQYGRKLIPAYTAAQGGLFAIERFTTKRTQWEAGMRYDTRYLHTRDYQFNGVTANSFFFHNASALIGATRTLRPGLQLSGQLSTGWRAPNVSELFSNGVHHGASRFEEGDANLRPERAFNSGLTLAWTHARVQAEAQVYANYVRDFIYLQPTFPPVLTVRGAFPAFAYAQTNALFTGIDAQAQVQWGRTVSTFTRASALVARNLNVQDYLIGMPPARLRNELWWNRPSEGHSWKAGLTHQWVARQHFASQGTEANPADYLAPPPAYQLFGIQGEYSHNLPNGHCWIIAAECANALNASYRDYLDAFRYFTDAPGRSLNLRLQYTF